jgi:hypothetical protein
MFEIEDIIIGYGEIGKSVGHFFIHEHLDINDEYEPEEKSYKFMHIAFPYSKDFVKIVKKMKKRFNPQYTIIHSTVPIGTSRKCGAIHSPVVGIHPHLQESLKTFVKFIGGDGDGAVANHFRRNGLRVYLTDKPESTELLKILCTTNYGMNIEFTKEAKRLCEQNGVPFELFTLWNNNYNEGYEKLGYPEYHRYNLIPMMRKIGGHCILPNYLLLKSKFTEFLKCL